MGGATLLIKQKADNNLLMVELFEELKTIRYDSDAAIKAITLIMLTRQKLNGSFQKFPKKIRRRVKKILKGKTFQMTWKNIDGRKFTCSHVENVELTGDNFWKFSYHKGGMRIERNIKIDGILNISIK